LGVSSRQRGEAVPPVRNDDAIPHRLRTEAVLVPGLDPKDISNQVEGVDLTAPVAQELGGADKARENLVDEGCPVTLGEDLLVLSIGVNGADRRNRSVADVAWLRRFQEEALVRSAVCIEPSFFS
jgi:hypothetical protein